MLTKAIAAIRSFIPQSKRSSVVSDLEKYLIGGSSGESIRVTEDSVYALGVVYSCVNVIAQTVGALPLKLYRREANGNREEAPAHPVYSIVHDRPNDYLLPSSWKETAIAHVLTWGNAYAEIERDASGRVVALWPIPPWRVQVKYSEQLRGPEYHINLSVAGTRRPEMRVLGWPQVLHIPGLSFDGLVGVTPISKAPGAFVSGLSAQSYSQKFFAQGALHRGVLSAKGALSDAAYKNLKESIAAQAEGLSNANRFLLLEDGLTWQEISISPQDSQMLETQKYSAVQICGLFRVPPHKVGLPEMTTNNNIEAQNISFLADTISPWLTKIEEAVSLRLLTAEERRVYYPEFIQDAYLRGDVAARAAYYEAAMRSGWMSINDIRRKENMNAVPGGDAHYRPLNTAPVGEQGEIKNGQDETD